MRQFKIVSAWNNGGHPKSGAGYGLKIRVDDRDFFFNPKWKTVILELDGYHQTVEVNVKRPSFWGPICSELISKDIGIWLRQHGLAPWPKGKPPKLELVHLVAIKFMVRQVGV